MTKQLIHYVWWPEGCPEDAVRNTSWWKHQWSFAKQHLYYGFRVWKAKRIREALSNQGPPDPLLLEYILQTQNLTSTPKRDWNQYIPDPNHWVDLIEFKTHSVV